MSQFLIKFDANLLETPQHNLLRGVLGILQYLTYCCTYSCAVQHPDFYAQSVRVGIRRRFALYSAWRGMHNFIDLMHNSILGAWCTTVQDVLNIKNTYQRNALQMRVTN